MAVTDRMITDGSGLTFVTVKGFPSGLGALTAAANVANIFASLDHQDIVEELRLEIIEMVNGTIRQSTDQLNLEKLGFVPLLLRGLADFNDDFFGFGVIENHLTTNGKIAVFDLVTGGNGLREGLWIIKVFGLPNAENLEVEMVVILAGAGIDNPDVLLVEVNVIFDEANHSTQ